MTRRQFVDHRADGDRAGRGGLDGQRLAKVSRLGRSGLGVARVAWAGACLAPALALAVGGTSLVAAMPMPFGGTTQHSWRTIASGGSTLGAGPSVGGGFTLVGTIGQHAPSGLGAITGPSGPSQVALTAGFWAAVGDAAGRSCPADFGSDGVVDGADLGTLLSNWGGEGDGDIDGNGVVDGADLGALLSAWGPCP